MIKKGQVSLIILLITAVLMTVGLSISRRAVVDTRVDTDQEQLKQAFNAAEGGIDYFLKTGQTTFNSVGTSSSAQVSETNLGGGSTISYGELTPDGTELDYWLVGHNSDGSINYGNNIGSATNTLCVNRDFTGSIKVDYYYQSAGQFKVWRTGFNISAANPINGYMDKTGGVSCGGVNGPIALPLNNVPAGAPLLLAVRPIGDGAMLSTILSVGSYPVQGLSITSIGRAGGTAGKSGGVGSSVGVGQQIKVNQRYAVPRFMTDTIVAGNSVLSN